jgi:3-oxoadipate enol-lactonase
MEPMVEPSVARWFAPGFRNRKPAEAARVEAMVRRTAPAGYCGCAAALSGLDYGPRLRAIAIPTLYLVGAHDSGAPPAVMRSMQAATPGARSVEIPDAGHLSALEQPEAVAAALTEFFSNLAATENRS